MASMLTRTSAELLRDRFGTYLSLARERGYCGPFVPYVGPSYWASDFKIAYAGVAPFYNEPCLFGDPAASKEWTQNVVEKADIQSAFWTLLDDITAIRYGTETALERRRRMVWTNLSKPNKAERTAAPSDNDLALRVLLGFHPLVMGTEADSRGAIVEARRASGAA
jgi:hypothetical protein